MELFLFPLCELMLCLLPVCAIIKTATVFQGGWTSVNEIGGDAMKNFSFQDLMAFGMFIIALLTFIRLMCL